jgi:hypothetical protein
MRALTRDLYRSARTAQWDLTNHLIEMDRGAQPPDLPGMVDDLYGLRETWKLLDSMRRDVNKRVEALERKICLTYIALPDVDGDPVKTDFCTASPDAKQTVKLPAKDSPEYRQLLAYFGVPLDAPFSPDWNKMIERVTQELAEGKPCPPGCDPKAMYTICKVAVKKRRPILDEKDAPPLQDPTALRMMAECFNKLRQIDPESVNHEELYEQVFDVVHKAREAVSVETDADEAVKVEKKVRDDSAVPSFMKKNQEEDPF